MKKLSLLTMLPVGFLAPTSYALAQQQNQLEGQGDQLVQIVRNATDGTRMPHPLDTGLSLAASAVPTMGLWVSTTSLALSGWSDSGERRKSRPDETASPDL